MNAISNEPVGTDPFEPVMIGTGHVDAEATTPARIGFKAHNLARMDALGLPVPPAFVLGTAWCARTGTLRRERWAAALAALEARSGLTFGDPRRPLLLSVRSGAAVSMPGMMETLLDVGLTERTLPGLIRVTGNPRLAWDAYRRLVATYGEVVMGVPADAFERDLASVADGEDERQFDFARLRRLAAVHLDTVRRHAGRPFPQDPMQQLDEAIVAVFASWSAPKALTWRAHHGLADGLGTAVTVQRMVFGNAGGRSGAGVGFTRHPSTGAPEPWVDFLFDAQGEDVVSGRRSAGGHETLAVVMPEVWQALLDAVRALERALGDMQDFEFTVEEGHLYLLQTRTGRRTPQAAARIALDLLDEGVIDAAQARERTAGLDRAALSGTELIGDGGTPALAAASSACTGVATGPVAFDEAAARRFAAEGRPPVLVRAQAETADIGAIEIAAGLLTRRGARTSHAAVVARQLGKVCLVGCEALQLDPASRSLTIGTHRIAEGDLLTLDGNGGAVFAGALRTVQVVPEALLERLDRLRTTATDPAPAGAPR